jgi:hypothetical protein
MEDRNVEKRQDLEEVQDDTEIPVLSETEPAIDQLHNQHYPSRIIYNDLAENVS